MSLKLVIGDKNYSSWSLRAALALDLTGEPYEEILERLYRPDSRARLLSHSPTGKVPVLLTEEGPVWDSLAIAEYLAERFPEAHLWPRGQYARALARSKALLLAAGQHSLAEQLAAEQESFVACALEPDFRTGLDAFFARRKPVYPVG